MSSTLLVLIPLLPLLSCLFTAACGKRWLAERAHWPTVAAFAGSFLCAVMLLWNLQGTQHSPPKDGKVYVGEEETTTLWTWANVTDAERLNGQQKSFSIDVTLRADPLTAIMLCMVTFVATLIAIYSSGYMHGDPGYARFFTYISLFVFSMTMLVSVSNFVLLYVFREAVGLCSYLLIGFWFQKPAAVAAGKKAFLVNRIGDFGFALGLFLIWTTYGTLNFHDTHTADGALQTIGVLGQTRLADPLPQYVGGGVATAICLLLLLGACGKSAQFPLHVWLPDAMEGPTPVSALIHAATMVTAGVYMVARCTPLFHASPDAQMVVAIVGAFTALLAGLIALTQTDLKRVMAYSTVSQLGYMFLSLGTGSLLGVTAGMFHLFTHAFFKALLFLGSGSVMHAMGGVIDMRRFGGLRKLMPITHVTFLFGALALAGIVPFAGFWSKDMILDAVHERMHAAGDATLFNTGIKAESLFHVLYYSALFTAFLTAFYTFRAFFMTFYGEERIPQEAGHHAHESPQSMTGPLCVLAVCALTVGAYFALTGSFAAFLQRTPSLAYGPLVGHEAAQPEFNMSIAQLSTAIAIGGISLAAYLYLGSRAQAEWLAKVMRPAYLLSYGKFFVDEIYQVLVVKPLEFLSAVAYWIDQYIVDGLVNLCGAIPPLVGTALRGLQSGLVQTYALLMILGALILFGALALNEKKTSGNEPQSHREHREEK